MNDILTKCGVIPAIVQTHLKAYYWVIHWMKDMTMWFPNRKCGVSRKCCQRVRVYSLRMNRMQSRMESIVEKRTICSICVIDCWIWIQLCGQRPRWYTILLVNDSQILNHPFLRAVLPTSRFVPINKLKHCDIPLLNKTVRDSSRVCIKQRLLNMTCGYNELSKWLDNFVHHVDSVAAVLLVHVYTPVLHLRVDESVKPSLYMNTLLEGCHRRVFRVWRVLTQLITQSNTSQAQILRSHGQILLSGVNDGFFSRIGSNVAQNRANEVGNLLVDNVQSLRHETAFLIDGAIENKCLWMGTLRMP